MKLTFRGEAGEVTLGFVNPLTFLTGMPVMLLSVLVFGVTAFIAAKLGLSGTITLPLMAASTAPIIGLYACAARRGHFDVGAFEALAGEARSQVPAFCVRYIMLAVAWGVPLALLARQAGGSLGAIMSTAFMGGLGAPSAGTDVVKSAWLVMSVLAVAALAPPLSLIVATRAESMGDVFSGRLWTWLLKDRGDDLVPFFATYIGGMMLFAIGLVPLAALIVPMAFSVSEGLGQAAVMFLPVAPLAAAPIFLGRLAGAFVAADFASESAQPAVARVTISPEPRPQAPAPAARPVSQRDVTLAGRTEAGLAGLPIDATMSRRQDSSTAVDGTRGGSGLQLGVALARAHQRAETDPHGALEEINALRAQHGRNPAVAGEQARLLLRLGEDEEARKAAADAIRFALAGGAGPIAFDVFMAFAAHAPLLGLDATTHDQLAKILLQRQELDGAAWCFRAVATLGGEASVAQKGVLSVAEAALRHGQPEKAADLFEGFLRTWPDSTLRPFAVDGLDQARRKQATTVG